MPLVLSEETIERHDGLRLMVVARHLAQHTFVVLPRQSVVKRTLAWLNRSRIVSKEWTQLKSASEGWISWASQHCTAMALVL